MRKSPTIPALGSALLALGLVVSAAPVVSADVEPVLRDPEQLAALQRDLGLTRTEAVDLVVRERQARATERELRSALGPDFGGAVFDADTRELTVAVTDPDAAEAVRDAGAQARVVTYGEDALGRVMDELNGSVGTGYPGVTGWYPDVEQDAVVMTVLPGGSDDAQQAIAAAGVDPEAVVISEVTEPPRTFVDIVGGDPYFINDQSRCSIGFGVTEGPGATDGSDDNGGFVTAGHCGSVGSTASSSVPAEGSEATGTFVRSMFPGDDMAFVGETVNWTPTAQVRSSPEDVAGSEEASVGASVCRSGSTSGWRCGEVLAKDQTVIYEQGIVFGLTHTSACAERGDSGGPFMSDDQAQGVLSGGMGNCVEGGSTFFQPVNEILDRWNLELVTTG
ncbi:S1 family peptidase [Nocardiopsis gilva YIM 90087]|uniref:S1 family peptidase n=1 Tax=Nocardiopsis gilva YIM 90087 TaxID=1235441 RepID=A0A223S0F3_9ACTN|nr:S1 family peptidase [Nocardiopsis gilva]ASU81615.1 S1 family peptidase [Nocardiopsis gilva YIM 90087]